MYQRLTPERFGFVLALFYHRQLPPSASLTTGLYPLAPRPALVPGTNRRISLELQDLIPHFRALPSATASSRAVGEPGTGAEVVKDRTEPVLDKRSVYIKYVTEPGSFSGQINPFLPLAAARPLTIRSWP